ncbi:MAG: metallophosphoesterase, partial [Gemmatimonadota bacterium]
MMGFRFRSLTVLVGLVATGCAPAEVRGPELGSRVELVVLGTTDVHGRLVPWDYFTGREVDYGLARVATLVDSIRAAEPHVLLLDSGDLLQGNPLTYYWGVVAPPDTHPVVHAMNLLRYDAAAIGNHEFNYGLDALGRAFEDAAFPLLAG